MKKLSVKITSVIMAAAMLTASASACSKPSGSSDKVSSDSDWFNVTEYTIGSQYNSDDYEYLYSDVVTYDDNYIYYRTDGLKNVPDDFNYETDDYYDYVVQLIDVYDYEGNLVSSNSIADELSKLSDNSYIESYTKTDDGLKVTVVAWDDDYNDNYYSAILDPATGEIGEFIPAEEDDIASLVDDGSQEQTFTVGEYTMTTFWISNDSSYSYEIVVTDKEGNNEVIDVRDYLPNLSLYDISGIFDMGNGTALIIGSGEGANGSIFLTINLSDFSVSEYEEDMSWLDNYIYNISSFEGVGAAVCNSNGICKINFETKQLDSLFSFDNCNVNRYDVTSLTPISVTEDRVVMTGMLWRPSIEEDGTSEASVLMVFDKAESNPNEGKTVIELAMMSGYDYAICDAVCDFNENSDEYIIYYNDEYTTDNYIDYGNNDDDTDYDVIYEKAQAEMANQLAIDVMSGDGPDIIFGGAMYNQLNNGDYLIDLNTYISDNLNTDNYFANIFEAAETNGGLYQMPLAFVTSGIITNADSVEDGQVGFTFDQYVEFVDKVCNGTNPIYISSQIAFFIEAVNEMWDLMIDDNGKINFDNDAFRALAEYTDEYVFEKVSEEDGELDYYVMTDDSEEKPATTTTLGSINSYINEMLSGTKERVYLGRPSYDGRGPLIMSYYSIGISAQSDSSDACLDFLGMLLSDEYQELIGTAGSTPVSRAAFTSVGQKFCDSHNRMLERYRRDLSESEIRNMGMNPNEAEYSMIDDYAELISGLTCWYTSDSAINAIIREEMPAYFSGQKSLDQVIEVLEDRVNTVVSERG